MHLVDAVTAEELRRAFGIAVVADAGREAGPSLEDALAARYPDDRIDALMARILLIFLFLETDDGDALVRSVSLLGVPDLHPAIYDVAATHPIPHGTLPKPRPFFRALEERLRLYETIGRGAG